MRRSIITALRPRAIATSKRPGSYREGISPRRSSAALSPWPVASLSRYMVVWFVLGIVWNLAVPRAEAVIILLKGQDEPLCGYFVRENEHVIVIKQPQSDGSTPERTISRNEIEDVIQTVIPARLEALQPDNPDGYREYAEELAEKSKDPDAQVTAIRLFLIAAHLQPQRLGRSCLLAMVPLSRQAEERRRFSAMAYLLDPTHDPRLLAFSGTPRRATQSSEMPPRQAAALLRAFRLLRQGKQRDAMTQARRIKLQERLPLLTDTITYDEFEQACEPTCPHCQRGHQPCPACDGQKFVLGKSCARCSATGKIRCAVCGGDYRHNQLPPSLLKRIVRLELDTLAEGEPAIGEPASTSHPAWSQSVAHGELDPLPPLTLETLTEFDPRENLYRDGKWSP